MPVAFTVLTKNMRGNFSFLALLLLWAMDLSFLRILCLLWIFPFVTATLGHSRVLNRWPNCQKTTRSKHNKLFLSCLAVSSLQITLCLTMRLAQCNWSMVVTWLDKSLFCVVTVGHGSFFLWGWIEISFITMDRGHFDIEWLRKCTIEALVYAREGKSEFS